MSRRGERGAGSVLILCVGLVVMTAVFATAALAAGVTARRQAAAAADLAVLAAAGDLQRGDPDSCRRAAEVAVRNRATLRDCVVDGVEVEVRVRVDVSAPMSWLPPQHRRARAGPR